MCSKIEVKTSCLETEKNRVEKKKPLYKKRKRTLFGTFYPRLSVAYHDSKKRDKTFTRDPSTWPRKKQNTTRLKSPLVEEPPESRKAAPLWRSSLWGPLEVDGRQKINKGGGSEVKRVTS